MREENTPGQGKNNLKGLEVLNWVLGTHIAAEIDSLPARLENLKIHVALSKVVNTQVYKGRVTVMGNN